MDTIERQQPYPGVLIEEMLDSASMHEGNNNRPCAASQGAKEAEVS